MAMRSELQSLNGLEQAVLELLLAGDHPVLARLRRQLPTCRVKGREMTGHGFYARLVVDRAIGGELVPTERMWIRDVGGEILGLQHGAGFALCENNGVLDFLEGFTYDEPWPAQISEYSLHYDRARVRDPGAVDLPSVAE